MLTEQHSFAGLSNGERRTRTADTSIFSLELLAVKTRRFAGDSPEEALQTYRWFPGDSWGFGPGGGHPRPKPKRARRAAHGDAPDGLLANAPIAVGQQPTGPTPRLTASLPETLSLTIEARISA